MKRISHLNEHKRKVLIKSFVMSQYNYCTMIWMFCQRRWNKMINIMKTYQITLLKKDKPITIDQRNMKALIIETIHQQNPVFMEKLFCIRQHKYSTDTQNVVRPNPRTVTYGTETFGYIGNQLWNKIPTMIENESGISKLKQLYIY